VTVAAILTEFSIPSGNILLVLLNLIFLGTFLVPIIPVSMNFGSELTFPVAPALTNGLLLMVGQAVGAVLGIVMTPLSGVSPPASLGIYIFFSSCAIFVTLFLKEELRKR
jgi:hypothetical protein